MPGENLPGRGGLQEGQKRRGIRVLRSRGQRRGIDDLRVAGGRKHASYFHMWFGQGIGLLDDTRRRFATGHQLQRGAHIF